MHPPTFRLDIEGLRAIAVISVIINHISYHALPSGYLGVDIFFVVSGYVITGSILKIHQRSFLSFVAEFYARRIKRIISALIVCVVLTSLVISLINPSPEISLRTGLASIFGLANVYLYLQATDYFAPSSAVNSFTQTWSLGVEEQFYLFFPFLIYIYQRHTGLFTKYALIALLTIISLSSLAAFIYLIRIDHPSTFFLLPTRLWELGIGSITFFGKQRLESHPQVCFTRYGSLALLISMILILFMPSENEAYNTPIIVIITSLMLIFIKPHDISYRLLTLNIFTIIGKISYSLYLWHWSVLSISLWTIGIDGYTAPLLVLLMLAISSASYKYIEAPLRQSVWASSNAKTVGLGILALLVTASLLWLCIVNHKLIYIQSKNDLKLQPAFLPLIGSGLPYNPNCVVDSKDRPYDGKKFNLCTVSPEPPEKPTIWALGDSHAGHLQGLLYALHDKHGIGIHLIETPGIPFPFRQGSSFKPRIEIFEEIKSRIRKGDIVLVSRLFTDRNGGKSLNDPLWYEELPPLAEQLSQLGAYLVIAGPPPIFQYEDIRTCKINAISHASLCEIDRWKIAPEIDAVYNRLQQQAVKTDNLFIFNQFELLCPHSKSKCSPYKGDTFLFRDKDHLNSYGSALLAESLVDFLNENHIFLQ